jgi:hypothetical protein
MKNQLFLVAVASASLLACGDNKSNNKTDAPPPPVDGSGSGSNGPPAAPTLGPQIDRMGRPLINTALNHGFDGSNGVPSSAANASKDAYNHDQAVGTWPQTWAQAFASNLALLDALDSGVCGNGICEAGALEDSTSCAVDCGGSTVVNGSDGCGNQAFFNGSAGSAGYMTLATLLADDELYVDTSRSSCTNYLAVEFYYYILGSSASTCGGRAPSYDVVDSTYTLAVLGVAGFNPINFAPAFGDTVSAHTDIDDATFPFLGAPH